MKRKYYWGGFVSGKLHHTKIDDAFGTKNIRLSPMLFILKKDALRQYEDVRKVIIEEHPDRCLTKRR